MQDLLRSTPTQARSKKTYDHILATAAAVLEDVGWDGLTTNLVAQRAGVGIQSLYRYFPNKLSIVATIADHLIADWNIWLEEYDASVPEDIPPGKYWAEGIRDHIRRLKSWPGGVAIRRAMKSSPVLRRMDLDDTKQIAIRLADISHQRGHCAAPSELEPAFLMLTETAVSLLDLYFECEGELAEIVLQEGLEMQAAYVERILISEKHRPTG